MTVPSDNYFQLLGLDVSFDIDLKTLNNNYRELQRAVHPDKYANASDRDRRMAMQKASQINDALQTLKSPLNRGKYLLALHGHELGENEQVEPMFLMEQMELRESLGEIKAQADPMASLGELQDDVNQRLKALKAELSELFADAENPSEEALATAKQVVLKMQFLHKLNEECLSLEEELADAL